MIYYPQPTDEQLEPVDVTSIRTWIRVMTDEFDDSELAEVVEAALVVLQAKSKRILRLQNFTLRMPCFEAYWIKLFPLVEVSGITYQDANDDTQTLDTALYTVVSRSEWDNILTYKGTLPDLYDRWDAVTVTIKAGYTAQNLPANIKQAVRHLVRYWYDNPDSPKQEFPSLLDWILTTFTNDVFA